MSTTAFAFGLGLGTHNSEGEWLEVFFAEPVLNPPAALVNAAGACDNRTPLNREQLLALEAELAAVDETRQAQLAAQLAGSDAPVVAVLLAEDAAPTTVPEAYLKLHLLSHRLVKPHGTNLQGLFGILPNVAWTSEGAIDIGELPARQLAARLRGETLEVSCIDKFPKMTNYVVPGGVRIAHTARVRLGAYLGAGTTIMHVETVKARELAGKSELLFRRNSTNGSVECLTNRSAIELNAELHAHN